MQSTVQSQMEVKRSLMRLQLNGDVICGYSLSCFGMRYSPNEIAIKWRGAICEFPLMFYEG